MGVRATMGTFSTTMAIGRCAGLAHQAVQRAKGAAELDVCLRLLKSLQENPQTSPVGGTTTLLLLITCGAQVLAQHFRAEGLLGEECLNAAREHVID